MNISSFNSVSFKGCMPVAYMAKNPKTGDYVPVLKNENLRKCHGFVVRNLNGTAKKARSDEFVKEFYNRDKDYRNNREVRSVYQDRGPYVFLITGDDIIDLNNMAKPVGIAKAESLDALGHTKSFEAKYEANNYLQNAIEYATKECKRVKSPETGNPQSLIVYCEPKITKKTNKITGFNYVGHKFFENDNEFKKVIYESIDKAKKK